MNRSTGSIYQIMSDIKSIASEKRNASDTLPSTCVDAVVLQDHDRLDSCPVQLSSHVRTPP
jgi:hypothetical protein